MAALIVAAPLPSAAQEAPVAAVPAPDVAAPPDTLTAPPPAECVKAQFETAVDDAAAALRDLNARNKPELQDKLRQLKDKRGWSQDQFIKEAAPFVKDAAIEEYDAKTNDLLADISAMGEAGSAASTPDCTVLTMLNGHMSALVETQTAKWSYMFGKLDAELGR